uniref:Actin interacting protein 3-like C-terminal domain-containing protein n=1 Tax=Paramormyrops kingsleyae TaxID=1676925 RepID=A0A3B3QD21_9TELE
SDIPIVKGWPSDSKHPRQSPPPPNVSLPLGLQSRSPKHSTPPKPAADLGEHFPADSLDSLETMSDLDGPCAFTRGIRSRASLPVVRSTNQTKDRSLGVLYLQYGDDSRVMRMPNEITSGDTIRALFVSAFPQQLTMKMLDSPSMAIYIKDDMRNVYYELSDVRWACAYPGRTPVGRPAASPSSMPLPPYPADVHRHNPDLYCRGLRVAQHVRMLCL